MSNRKQYIEYKQKNKTSSTELSNVIPYLIERAPMLERARPSN